MAASASDGEAQRAVRVAVIGVGHLGKSHARILASLPEAELVGVVDVREDVAKTVGEERGVPWSSDPINAPLEWGAEACSVVVPTVHHAELAAHYLESGLDILVEKPITRNVEDAERLCEIADARGRVLQVGHVERFNPAVRAVADLDVEPRYIEAERLAPFTFRSTDIGVVLDLMIHDLDLVQSLVDSELSDVEAFGGGLFTPAEDLCSARLKYASGAVARVTANRVALKSQRRMRMFSRDSYVSLDFGKRYGLIIQKAPGWDTQKLDLGSIDTANLDLRKFVFEGLLTIRELKMDDLDPLEEELRSFLACVRTRQRPIVDGRVGLEALRAATRVLEALAENPW